MVTRFHKGFTLIELMIVVAIIGILASIALPAYQTYVAKAKMTSIFATMMTGKAVIFEQYVEKGRMPTTAEVSADGPLKDYVEVVTSALPAGSSVLWAKSVTETKFQLMLELDGINGHLNGHRFAALFIDDGSTMYALCLASASVPNKYLPKQCWR